MVNFNNDWDEVLKGEFEKEYYLKLRKFLIIEYKSRVIYPDMYDIFNAFKLTPYRDVKAVIIGQDPYPGEGQAHGLCFSVKKGVPVPKSLQNIYRELKEDVNFEIPGHGCLESWAKQGVLLLNTVLTVRGGSPNSHQGMGWEIFTDEVIKKLNERREPMVFILWGRNAKSKKVLINNEAHMIIEGAHPSPLSCYKGFYGGRYFSRTNEFLSEPIDWRIQD